MPWTEKQLKLFRAAAHNPAIAKSSGIKQEDAARMAKEGVKKATGGLTKATINKQDTRHGKVDMPFAKLNRYAGMKKGGIMKKRRFNGEEESYVDDSVEPEVERSVRYSTPVSKYESPSKSAAKTVAKSSRKESDYGDEVARRYSRIPEKEDTSAVTGMASRKYRNMPSPERKEENARRLAEETAALALGASAGRVAKGVYDVGKKANEIRRTYQAMREAKAAARTPEDVDYIARAFRDKIGTGPKQSPGRSRGFYGEEGSQFKKGGSVMLSKRDIQKDQYDMGVKAVYKKGGDVKESKAMMKKEIEFFKKKGAPKSMIKHEEAEMKAEEKGSAKKYQFGGTAAAPVARRPMPVRRPMVAPAAAMPVRRPMPVAPAGMPQMKKGGKCMARGGGVEQRGKTKGTVIKMASGGYVRSADGITQRGKTKGKIV